MTVGPSLPPDWPELPACADGQQRLRFEPMKASDLDEVMAIEQWAYTHAWSRRHFADSLSSGHAAVTLRGAPQDATAPLGELVAYLVAMEAVDEVHLLNITVAPERQGQGWGRCLLDALTDWAARRGAQSLWLEVRASNARARAVYERHGFVSVGLRRGYYPAREAREDAVVMRRDTITTEVG